MTERNLCCEQGQQWRTELLLQLATSPDPARRIIRVAREAGQDPRREIRLPLEHLLSRLLGEFNRLLSMLSRSFARPRPCVQDEQRAMSAGEQSRLASLQCDVERAMHLGSRGVDARQLLETHRLRQVKPHR